MIQRIQTIFLLIAMVLLIVAMFSPLAVLVAGDNILFYKVCGFYKGEEVLFNAWGLLTFASVSALLSLITIFMYKNRKLQVRLCNINIITIVIAYITFGVYLNAGLDKLEATFLRIDYGIALPAIAIILIVLAISRIKKDERLVRSLDRIR